MNIEQAIQIKIVDFLASEGYHPTSIRGKRYRYLSPYRNERTPSFFVNIEANVWYDFGAGEGGSIILLAKRIYHTDSTSEVLRRMETRSHAPVTHNKPPCVKIERGMVMEKVSFQPLSHHALLRYILVRGVDPYSAQLYCKEVHYECRGKKYFAIAFANDSGGCELRNPYFKGCMGKKDVTIIHSKQLGSEQGKACCLVFEGFFSFLSYLTLRVLDRLPNPASEYDSSDYIILNSVINVKKVIDKLGRYDCVFTYLDNDDAGKIATEVIKEAYPDAVKDDSSFYYPHNDINDYLCEKLRRGL